MRATVDRLYLHLLYIEKKAYFVVYLPSHLRADRLLQAFELASAMLQAPPLWSAGRLWYEDTLPPLGASNGRQ